MRQIKGFFIGLSAIAIAATPVWSQEVEPMNQVTSVSELSDVRPSDWAFQAVQSLVERYGVLTGYPDRTFRGNRPLTRNEFAATIATVIGRIEEQLLAGNTSTPIAEDVQTIRRLINAYGGALSQLRSRVDNIGNRIATQESQQFSTTTKLNGQVYYVVTNGTNADSTVISRVRLNLLTSFQGEDRLVTQIEAGNNGADAIANAHNDRQNLLGTTGILADGGGLDPVGATRDLNIRKLYYAFRPAENLEIAVGSNLPPSDFIDRNSFANQSGDNFGSSFFANNPLIVQNEIDRFGGAGAAIAWSLDRNLTLRALYAAADASNVGLFRDRYQASVEAEYDVPDMPIKVQVQYTNAEINGTQINAAGVSAEWAIQRRFGVFGIFGRLGIGNYQGFNTLLQQDLDLNPKTWALGVTFQNFLIPGSRAGVAVGQPFITRRLGSETQTNFEAFFGLLLNDRLNVSPSVTIVTNPNNRASPTIVEWSLRVLYGF
ncbi:iron uptake porin [Leptolyngbya sp. NIES-2104]|uniref:iron uptake porin n=1 Tax=Leptolyngbya sp. NIES-2104 TaxID=1552121 RepID=UPI0006EC6FC4|nr:iron uptake porin [Leptolyngbya sp. NIES-2104]GAP94057.1 outer membrane protein [Leptolyngbya sp. NIES-2104]